MRNLGFSLGRNYVATIGARRAHLGCDSVRDVRSMICTTARHNRRGALKTPKGLIFGITIIAALAASLAIWHSL